MTESTPVKVLIAEDEQDLSSALEVILSEAGFVVTITNDGEAAWEAYQAELPDVVLLDIHMPKMTGLEVLGKIRADEAGKAIPITVLTATDTMGALSDVTTIGGPKTDFISKTDFSLEQIMQHVQRRVAASKEQ